jgi:hypothetical protein
MEIVRVGAGVLFPVVLGSAAVLICLGMIASARRSSAAAQSSSAPAL